MQKLTNIAPSTRSKGRPREFDREAALVRALDVFWRRGYEPASITELCAAMSINPPSLYSAFGNKAQLFLEAVTYYEKTYWEATWTAMGSDRNLRRGITEFFRDAARILTSTEIPCGCLVVLAGINVSAESEDVIEALKVLRLESKSKFLTRLKSGLKDGSLPPKTDIKALAGALNAVLEGLSIQARDGLSRGDLEAIGIAAVGMLPVQRST